jgi:L-lactate utilization protein LutC
METPAPVAQLVPNPEFAVVASDERIDATAAALRANGIETTVVCTGAEARSAVRDLIPEGAEVFNNTSVTLETTGVAEDIERSGRYRPVRLQLYQMDREMQKQEMRRLAAAPDHVVGSAHAVTEGGSLLVASASGSQLGPLASGAGRVILVVGGQKIVPDLETGLRRLREYSYPRENERALRAYGVSSGVNNILIVNRVLARGRVTVILVREALGF